MSEDFTKADKLTEEDRLRIKALNLEIDNLEMQRQIILRDSMEKQRQLNVASLEIKEKYGIDDPKQINLQTGDIFRGDPDA